jgi:hypothetical protein
VLRVVERLRTDETVPLSEINADVIPMLEAKKKEEAADYVSGMANRLVNEGYPLEARYYLADQTKK